MKGQKKIAVAKTVALRTAATAALFSLQHQAQAGIIYSGIKNITASVSPGHNSAAAAGVGINVDGVGGFDLRLRVADLGGLGYARFLGLGGVLEFDSSQLRKLASGSRISGGAVNVFAAYPSVRDLKYRNNTGVDAGFWSSNKPGLAGFRFNVGHSTHYGWIRLIWSDKTHNSYPDKFTAIDWAYESTANAAILAGATSSSAVPEPSSALLFLAGVGGLALFRLRAAKKKV